MSKYMDKRRKSVVMETAPKAADIDISEMIHDDDTEKKTFDELMMELEKRLEPVKRLKDFDPELLKTVSDKVASNSQTIVTHSEVLEKHRDLLENHGGRLDKLEKDVADLAESGKVLSAKMPAEVIASPESVVTETVNEYEKLYPKDPVPHHVSPAFYVKLADGTEILRYLEADAIRIANTEELKEHRAISVDAWADEKGLLIRPLRSDESLKLRKMT